MTTPRSAQQELHSVEEFLTVFESSERIAGLSLFLSKQSLYRTVEDTYLIRETDGSYQNGVIYRNIALFDESNTVDQIYKRDVVESRPAQGRVVSPTDQEIIRFGNVLDALLREA